VVVSLFLRRTFTVVNKCPIGKILTQFAGLKQEHRVAGLGISLSVIQVNGRDNCAARFHAGANCGKQIALQVIKHTNQIVSSRVNMKVAQLEIRDARIDCDPGFLGALLQDFDGYTRRINGGNLPAMLGQKDRMPANAACQIKRPPRL